MTNKEQGTPSTSAWIAFAAGLISLIALPIIALIGALIEDVGMMAPFVRIVFPSASIAIILGGMRRKHLEESKRGQKLAKIGMITGIVTVTVIVLLILFVLIIFAPGS